jgi:hypothetical protein
MLQERAAARSLPPATYAGVILRSHLRQASPLPRAELEALNASVSALAAIGRNLHEIARAATLGGTVSPARADLEALLQVCVALRSHVKDLLKANLHSWAVGDVEDQR